MTATTFPQRSQQVLGLLVREFIHTGEPVGSFVIARRTTLNVSSATIRHDLARLEEEGYVSQPHVSAGRVPTDRGYRFYVDQLLESRPGRRTASAVEARLRATTGSPAMLDDVLGHVSQVLSRMSRHLGFAVAPPSGQSTLREIEFVSLGGTRVLVVLVTGSGQLTRKVVDIGEAIRPRDLRQAASYLNRTYAGRPLTRVRQAIIDQLQHERMLLDTLFARAMRLGQTSLTDLPEDVDLFVDGAASLLDDTTPHGVPLSTVSALLTMIEEKRQLARILNAYIDGAGVTVVIGTEHATPNLHPFSLVTATCGDGVHLGTVGIIGPTRMHYSRAIAAVNGVATAVSRVLAEGH